MTHTWKSIALGMALALVDEPAAIADPDSLCPSGSSNILAEMTAEAPEVILGSKSYMYHSGENFNLRVYVFSPPEAQETVRRPAILFFYGGAWIQAPIRLYQPHATHFALRGMVAILVDYRTKCRHGSNVLDSLADSRAAMRWVRAHAEELGIDSHRIAVAGSSAGAFMAAALATNPDEESSRNKTVVSIRPQALFLIAPALSSVEGEVKVIVTSLWGDAVARELASQSPLHNVGPELPPTRIFAGTADPLEPQAVEFCARAIKFHRDCELFRYEGGPHGFASAWYGLTDPAVGLKAEVWQADVMSKMDRFLTRLGWLPTPPDVKTPLP